MMPDHDTEPQESYDPARKLRIGAENEEPLKPSFAEG
jgi:hypothetical protein